jgi:biopolymer transport protein ExbB
MITRATLLPRFLLLLGFAAASAFPVTAHAWWNSDWTSRKKITIDTSASGVPIAGEIGAAPVLVRLHDGNFPFAAAKPDGSDLRFIAADDKTPLAFHLEKFDSLLNEAFVWVKVPDLKPGAQTVFWLYYGNGGSAATRSDDVKGTYDADTTLVYHFTERGQPANDASGNGNNAQTAGLPADGAMIGLGLRLDDRNSVSVPATGSLTWSVGAPLTWSAWVKFGPSQASAVIFSRQEAGRALTVGLDHGSPFVEVTNENGTFRSSAGTPVATDGWKHLALTAAGSTLTLYLDGEPYVKVNQPLPALNSPLLLGGDNASAFIGDIDELEISRVARSAGFIKFAALEQGGENAAKLITVGEEEQPKHWFAFLKTGYVGIIIGSLTVDGWVVIGLLGVMGVISWAVMLGKALYLGRVGQGNDLFLGQWRHVATDLSVLDSDDAAQAKSLGGRVGEKDMRVMRRAPLYRVYHVGAEEIRHRLAADRSSKVLSARSIQAIRASMDGALVRETHRLSSQMVLLTIAISGGPFLGLLGTVVGVMITFAAVAAAGDVNVNAIAPGIAAALAATVAGLAVAIPSLFGYNYLLTRIKAAQSDLHVFIDEFVAKMAEFYSETAEASRTITRAPFSPSEPPMPVKR